VLGQTNLWVRRRHRFRMDRIPAFVERVSSIEPDMVLSVGDLTTTSLPSEFVLARQAVGTLFERFGGLIVPGNHDRYTFRAARRRAFEKAFGSWTAQSWPHYRKLQGGLHLIGLDPTRPTFFTAAGFLGDDQLQRLKGLLSAIPENDRVIVMCHYPIGTPPGHPPEHWQHRLRDADRLRDVLSQAPQRLLYLHGHEHQPWCWRPVVLPGAVVINAGAPVLCEGKWPGGQGFWQVDVDEASEAEPWRLTYHVPDASGAWSARPVAPPAEPGVAASLD